MSRSSGGSAPEGNGWLPVYDCEACGASYTGGRHACRQADREPEREAG